MKIIRRMDAPNNDDNQETRFILELEAAPDALNRPAIIRLRSALKLLLRGYGLRCRAIRAADGGEVRP